MKVWINKRTGGYSGGLLLVAANSAQEAHELCLNSEKMEHFYWEWYYGEDEDETEQEVYNRYDWGSWQEVPNLYYAGVNPCIIAEEGYNE